MARTLCQKEKLFVVNLSLFLQGYKGSRTAGQSIVVPHQTVMSPYTWEPAYSRRMAFVLGFLGNFAYLSLTLNFW